MPYHSDAVSKDDHRKFRSVVDWLRFDPDGPQLSLGQIFKGAKLDKLINTDSSKRYQYLVDAYTRGPTQKVYDYVISFYKSQQRAHIRKDIKVKRRRSKVPAEKVVRYVIQNPGSSTNEIAKALGTTPYTIKKYVNQGYLLAMPSGNSVLHYSNIHENDLSSYFKSDEVSETTDTVIVKPDQTPDPTGITSQTKVGSHESISWDLIRSKLLSAANDIKLMADTLDLSHLPTSLRTLTIDEIRNRHRKLVEFIDNELD